MIAVDSISGFKEIFEIIPRTVVCQDMGMNYQTFTRKVSSPDTFTLREIIFMSQLFEVPAEILFQRIVTELPAKKKAK